MLATAVALDLHLLLVLLRERVGLVVSWGTSPWCRHGRKSLRYSSSAHSLELYRLLKQMQTKNNASGMAHFKLSRTAHAYPPRGVRSLHEPHGVR